MKISRKSAIYIGVIIIAVSVSFWLTGIAKESEFVRNSVFDFGYLGVFAVSIISGFNLVVPIPIVSFFPLFSEAGLDAVTSVFVIALGMTFADTISYFLGRIGGKAVKGMKGKKLFIDLNDLNAKHRFLPMAAVFFYASFAPIPNEVLTVPLGIIGYRFSYLILPLFAGNLIFNTISAFGIVYVFRTFF